GTTGDLHILARLLFQLNKFLTELALHKRRVLPLQFAKSCGKDILRRSVQEVRHGLVASLLRPKLRELLVGPPAKHDGVRARDPRVHHFYHFPSEVRGAPSHWFFNNPIERHKQSRDNFSHHGLLGHVRSSLIWWWRDLEMTPPPVFLMD